jgi:hypothetical protein
MLPTYQHETQSNDANGGSVDARNPYSYAAATIRELWHPPCIIGGMQKIRRMFETSGETILLPLVICVLLPGAAGAWWRHSHDEPHSQAPAITWPQSCPAVASDK